MSWNNAIIRVLTEEGRAMHYEEITRMIFTKGYRPGAWSKENAMHVNSVLTTNPDSFRMLDGGFYELINTSVIVKTCTSYSRGDSEYKCASDFVDSTVLSKLEKEEKNLLELIVNFCSPLKVNSIAMP